MLPKHQRKLCINYADVEMKMTSNCICDRLTSSNEKNYLFWSHRNLIIVIRFFVSPH